MVGSRTWAVSEARQMWPAAVVLLVAVLGPTVCVLWFMNEAVGNERLAVRQRLQDVYERELTSRQRRLDDHWEKVIGALAASRGKPAAAAFADLVREGGVSSAVIYREGQGVAYPVLPPPLAGLGESGVGRLAEGDNSERARELLAEARELLRKGERAQGVSILGGGLQRAEYARATDLGGRLLAPGAALLAVESLAADDAERGRIAGQLGERLRNYDDWAMSSPQRLFLMDRLHQIAGESFPTMGAEELAVRLAEMNGPGDPEPDRVLRPIAGAKDLWAFYDRSAQAVAIFTGANIQARGEQVLQAEGLEGTEMALVGPSAEGEAGAFLTVAAGRYLPNWKIVLTLRGADPFAAAVGRRATMYLWTACLAIGMIGLLGLGLGAYLRRQMRLTRLKNDLIATVSHELKTPLSSMRVLVETLMAGRVEGAQEQREYLALIARENMRLSRMIDNFLAFSRMERERAAFQFRRVGVEEMVRGAVEAMGERGVCVRVDVPEELAVWGDAGALTTVVVNLVDNAWKYSGEEKRIEVTGAAARGGVEIAVRDNGIGIAGRHQRRIFQRFYQVDRELSRGAGGCGLGLAIVAFIARAHRGKVTVTSQPGEGSTFKVWLPAATEADSARVSQSVETAERVEKEGTCLKIS